MPERLSLPEFLDMLGSRIERVARLGPSERDTVLFRMRMAPGQFVPLHSHADPECFYVLSGRLDVFVMDGGWRTIEAGASVLIVDGLAHAIRNPGGEATDIVLATNGRLARFFHEAGRVVTGDAPLAAPTPDDFRRVAAAAERFGYRLYPPAESNALTGVPPIS